MDYKTNDYETLYLISEDTDGSYDILYKKYLPIIKSIAKKYFQFVSNCGGEFQDLLQEGFIGLNNAITSYRESSNSIFYTYATLCVERQICTYCRSISTKKQQVLNCSLPDEDYSYRIVPDSTFFGTFYHSNENEIIYYLYQKTYLMDLVSRCVFELRFNGFSYKEISKLLDISVSTVDSRMLKVRKFLKKFSYSYYLN